MVSFAPGLFVRDELFKPLELRRCVRHLERPTLDDVGVNLLGLCDAHDFVHRAVHRRLKRDDGIAAMSLCVPGT